MSTTEHTTLIPSVYLTEGIRVVCSVVDIYMSSLTSNVIYITGKTGHIQIYIYIYIYSMRIEPYV